MDLPDVMGLWQWGWPQHGCSTAGISFHPTRGVLRMGAAPCPLGMQIRCAEVREVTLLSGRGRLSVYFQGKAIQASHCGAGGEMFFQRTQSSPVQKAQTLCRSLLHQRCCWAWLGCSVRTTAPSLPH